MTFYVDEAIYAENLTALGVDYTDGINDNEYWDIEAVYNNLGNDDFVSTAEEEWSRQYYN